MVFIGAALNPGIAVAYGAAFPLSSGLNTIFGGNLSDKVLIALSLPGLYSSMYHLIYAYGRQVYSMSRSGYYPQLLSLTLKKRRTPYFSIIFGSALAYVIAGIVYFAGVQSTIGVALLSMSVFAAIASYCLTMIAYIILKARYQTVVKDNAKFNSPFHIPGAVIGLLLSLMAGVMIFVQENVVEAFVGLLIWLFIGVFYFAVYSRKHLRFSPEEGFALFAFYQVKIYKQTRKDTLRPSKHSLVGSEKTTPNSFEQ